MKEVTENIIKNPVLVRDELTDVLRSGARKLLKEALEVEIESFMEEYKDIKLNNGHQRMVRNGYSASRSILTSLGEIDIQVPRAMDRLNKDQYHSKILPPYLRKAKN